jgi:hypothetical protein
MTTDYATGYPTALPVSFPNATVRADRPDRLMFVEDPNTGTVLVRWRLSPSQNVWKCQQCGPMSTADCMHTFSAGLFLAQHLLGLTPAHH